MTALSSRQSDLLDAQVRAVLPGLDRAALAGRRLFITGGTGFCGLWLLTALRCLNEDGAGIDAQVLTRHPEAFLRRNPVFVRAPWLRFVQGDIRDFTPPRDPFDLLLHGATDTSPDAHARPREMFDSIVMGSRHVIEVARRCGARRMLLLSSGAVYGPQPDGMDGIPEDAPLACSPMLATSAYGEGKRAMEMLGTLSGVDTVVARGFAFSGPGLPLDAQFAIGNFVRDALQADQITVQGDGTPLRSYLHGADLAVWLLNLLTRGTPGTAYNVGSDQSLSIADLARLVRDTLAPGKPVQILRSLPAGSPMPPRHRYVPSIARARRDLGCAPWTPLADSLRAMARFATA